MLKAGTISTNLHLRQIQNFALDLDWLPRPIIPRRQWPKVRFGERRAITRAWCHAAFSKDRKLHFPLLADFEPKGAVAQTYAVYRKGDGVSERALFVIDPEGKIHWSYVSPVGVNPGAAGILSALESLQPKEVAK